MSHKGCSPRHDGTKALSSDKQLLEEHSLKLPDPDLWMNRYSRRSASASIKFREATDNNYKRIDLFGR